MSESTYIYTQVLYLILHGRPIHFLCLHFSRRVRLNNPLATSNKSDGVAVDG